VPNVWNDISQHICDMMRISGAQRAAESTISYCDYISIVDYSITFYPSIRLTIIEQYASSLSHIVL